MAGDAARLKAEGNEHWAAGRTQDALQCYRAALDVAEKGERHILHSNISAALQKLGKHKEAREEADKCVKLAPQWAKGYLRQAAASQLAHRPGDAEGALRAGLKHVSDDSKQALQQELDRLLQEDGDQSQLRGYLPGTPAQNMRDLQAQVGLSMHAQAFVAALPNDAWRYAVVGQCSKFRAAFRPERDFKLRALQLRLPLVTVIVAGAQRFQAMHPDPSDEGHAGVMRLVCQAGCRVDARDLAGFTALSHATGHHPRLDLARILLQYGADPSARDRYGCAPLFYAIMAQEEESARLLLEAGADASAKDLDGVSVEKLAKHNPTILALVHKALGVHQQNAQLQRGGPCFSCGKPGATRRCGGCRTALYCTPDCQRAHWKEHKKQCGSAAAAATAAAGSSSEAATGAAASGGGTNGSSGGGGSSGMPAGHLRLKLTNNYGFAIPNKNMALAAAAAMGAGSRLMEPISLHHSSSEGKQQQPSGKNFVVKVQVPLQAPPGMPREMLIYNKTRSFQCSVEEGSSAGARQLAALVRQQGFMGQKAYFNAYQDAAYPGDLIVISNAMLPTQPW